MKELMNLATEAALCWAKADAARTQSAEEFGAGVAKVWKAVAREGCREGGGAASATPAPAKDWGVASRLRPSGKDGIAPFAHMGLIGQLIRQAQINEGIDGADELAKAKRMNHAVNLAGLVADANGHGVPARILLSVGLDEGKYLLIVGAEGGAINELGVHEFLSKSDLSCLSALLKYLRKGISQNEEGNGV